MPKNLHDLLKHQMKRLGLEYDSLPIKVDDWHAFLLRISNYYKETDKTRYLTERSLELSSIEQSELNKRLEDAQHIAHLGYWIHDIKSGSLQISSEMRLLFGYSLTDPAPTFDEIVKLIHPEDVEAFKQIGNRVLKDDLNYEMDIRIQLKETKKNRWIHYLEDPFNQLDGKNSQVYGIAFDITDRKEIESQVAEMNKKLIYSARRAGMAETATAVLHNVGNVLNSVNVSVEIIQESLGNSKLDKFESAMKMIQNNLPSINEYLTHDPKGKLLPEYLAALSKNIIEEYQLVDKELKSINEHVQHIKHIVSAQQSLTGTSGMTENVSIQEILNLALQICNSSFKMYNIEIKKEFGESLFIITDKSKVLQILINLIQNAKESLADSDENARNITIKIEKDVDNNNVSIVVEDNGMGIGENIISRIFTYGFTTKPHGHGFGLHSCLLMTKELGGSLSCDSKGIGQGACFVLTLPLTV